MRRSNHFLDSDSLSDINLIPKSLSHRFQNAGENITSTVNSSSRPRSIPNDNIHLAASGSPAKFPVGPIVDPSPGPTLLMAVAAPDIAVMKSSPSAESPAAKAAKQTIYRKKKPITAFETGSGITLRL
jgi:hypothetical protein